MNYMRVHHWLEQLWRIHAGYLVQLQNHRTRRFSHWLVKSVSPKFYADIQNTEKLAGLMPRPMTLFLKAMNKKKLVGAEIGVAEGRNALSILQELSVRKLFLIDPYLPYVEAGKQFSYANARFVAQDRLSSFRQVQFIDRSSDEASKILDEPLDFVYIDGNHSYENVKQDIANYYPLVRQGGVVGGHDYVLSRHAEVVRAVNEFVEGHTELRFYNVFPDWWIVK